MYQTSVLMFNPIAGGEGITITGTQFASSGQVLVDSIAAEVTNYTSREISIILPPLPHGTHSLHVIVDGIGLADMS